MGRLIDADKLKAQIEAHEIKYKFTPTDYQYGHNVGIDKAVADIDDAETVEAIPVDWIRGYIDRLKDMGAAIANRDAQAVSVMVDKWAMEQNGNAACGPDYCEIGEIHD